MRALTWAACLLALVGQAEPLRIASYSPGATQTLLDLGASSEIVAATRWCPLPGSHPADRRCDAFTPDLEALLQARPTLVVLPRLANPLWAEKCRGAGLNVLLLHPERADSVPKDIRLLGSAVGRNDRAEELAKALEGGETNPPRRLLIIWDGMMAGPDSYLAGPLKKAGFTSALDRGAWVKTDWETIAQSRPDAVLWIENSPRNSPISLAPKRVEEMSQVSAVKELKCVKKARIYQSAAGSDWLPGSGLINKTSALSTLRAGLSE